MLLVVGLEDDDEVLGWLNRLDVALDGSVDGLGDEPSEGKVSTGDDELSPLMGRGRLTAAIVVEMRSYF